MGDGALLEFESVVDAVHFAVKAQLALRDWNLQLAEDERVIYRIGINIGDVIVDGDDIYGDGVNVAARLEGLAQPGGICVSGAVRMQISGKLDLDFEDLGERTVKNISNPVSVHQVVLNDKANALQVTAQNTGQPPTNNKQTGLLASVALAVGLIVAGFSWWQPWTTEQSAPEAPGLTIPSTSKRLAVLPFRNVSDDPAQDFFALGLAEDLIADLTTINGIDVIARASSFRIGDDSGTSQDIANELGARYFIGGSVRRADDTLRISVNLVEASTETTIWAERFDGSKDDIFEFQDRILAQIVKALDVVLAPSEKDALQNGGTKSTEAFDAYLQGVRAVNDMRHLDVEGNILAHQSFQRAIEFDPEFAKAYAGLAWSNWLHYATVNYYSLERREKAFELAERSIVLADNALAHRTLAKRYYRIFGNGSVSGGNDLDKALNELRMAAELEPSNADILADFASLLALGDNSEKGLRLVDLAITLNPDHPSWYHFSRGLNLLFLGRYGEAVKAIRKTSENNASWNTPKFFLAVALALDGNDRLSQIALRDYEQRGSVSPTKLYQDAVFRRWPMAPGAAGKFAEGLNRLGVPASAN
jgi:TolB-like protein